MKKNYEIMSLFPKLFKNRGFFILSNIKRLDNLKKLNNVKLNLKIKQYLELFNIEYFFFDFMNSEIANNYNSDYNYGEEELLLLNENMNIEFFFELKKKNDLKFKSLSEYQFPFELGLYYVYDEFEIRIFNLLYLLYMEIIDITNISENEKQLYIDYITNDLFSDLLKYKCINNVFYKEKFVILYFHILFLFDKDFELKFDDKFVKHLLNIVSIYNKDFEPKFLTKHEFEIIKNLCLENNLSLDLLNQFNVLQYNDIQIEYFFDDCRSELILFFDYKNYLLYDAFPSKILETNLYFINKLLNTNNPSETSILFLNTIIYNLDNKINLGKLSLNEKKNILRNNIEFSLGYYLITGKRAELNIENTNKYLFVDLVNNLDSFRQQLYQKFEHVSNLKIYGNIAKYFYNKNDDYSTVYLTHVYNDEFFILNDNDHYLINVLQSAELSDTEDEYDSDDDGYDSDDESDSKK